MLNPAFVFLGPEDVLQRDELTREQKIEDLRRWKFDALQLQVADEENMGSEQPSDILDRVLQALHALNAGAKEVLPRDPHGRRVRTGSSGHPHRSEVAVLLSRRRLVRLLAIQRAVESSRLGLAISAWSACNTRSRISDGCSLPMFSSSAT